MKLRLFVCLWQLNLPYAAAMILPVSRTFQSLLRPNRLAHIRTTSSTTLLSSSSTTANNHIKSYKMEGSGEGTKVTVSTNTGHHLHTDIPKTMGGKNTAPQPVETLLAAWMGCTQVTALFVARHLPERRVSITNIEFENIEAFRDDRGALQLPICETTSVPSRLQRVTGTIKVYCRGGRLSEEQMEILKEQTELRCPVANMMIASGCSIDVDWMNGEKS